MPVLLHVEVRSEEAGSIGNWSGPVALALARGDLSLQPDEQLMAIDDEGRDVFAATFVLVRDIANYRLVVAVEGGRSWAAAIGLPKDLRDTGSFRDWAPLVPAPADGAPAASALEWRYDIEHVAEC